MKKENYIYIRVSTREQKMKGFSVVSQKALLLGLAEDCGDEIVEENIIIDDGFSASTLKRPGMQKLIRLIGQNKVDKVYIKSSDRLTRNKMNKEALKMVFHKFKTKIVSSERDWKLETAELEFQSDLKTLLDELEWKKIRPRTISGLSGSARSGNYVIGGVAPRGYKRIKREEKGSYILPIPEYEKYIVFIFESIATRRYNARTLAKIYRKNKVMGMRWYENSILQIVNNHIYYGRMLTNWFDSDDPKIKEHEKKDWYSLEFHTQPIITRELFEKCQKELHTRRRRTSHFYTYGNLVYCPHCHTYCVHESAWKVYKNGARKAYLYYRCPVCNNRINEEKIDESVSKYLEYTKLPKDKLKALEELHKRMGKVKVRKRYLDGDFDNDLLEEDEYRKSVLKCMVTINEIKKEIEKIENLRLHSFMQLSNREKRAIVMRSVKRIDVDIISKEKTVTQIKMNKENVLVDSILEKKVDRIQ